VTGGKTSSRNGFAGLMADRACSPPDCRIPGDLIYCTFSPGSTSKPERGLRFMRSCLLPVLGLVVSQCALSQSTETRPAFEVASIRQCEGTEPRSSLSASHGRLSIPCNGLFRLIQDAYQAYSDGTTRFVMQPTAPIPIEGFPREMSSYRYSINAKAASPQTMGVMMGPMLQRLLEERFHLKIRHEIRESSVYLMTVAKGGPTLEAAGEDSCDPAGAPEDSDTLMALRAGKPRCGVLTPATRNGSHFTLDEKAIGLDVFARLLVIGGLPVIDRTGVKGKFDIHLEWDYVPPDAASAESGMASDPPDTSMIGYIRKHLGLQLSPGKGPREFLVIDHLERPSEN
jgi:uncharacterized protein (TIGR03435 family)